jgi:hypothetical protein
MYYKMAINYANGLSTSRATVWAKTSAKTKRGICKALGRAVADQIKTDAFVVTGRLMALEHGTPMHHELRDLHNGPTITAADERCIVDAAQDRIFDIRY